jgi:hypothetical protein
VRLDGITIHRPFRRFTLPREDRMPGVKLELAAVASSLWLRGVIASSAFS